MSMIIIGGGASGTAALRAAIANGENDITLIEERATLGGLPFNSKLDDKLLLNQSPDGVGLDLENPLEFVEWLCANKAIAESHGVQFKDTEGKLECDTRFVPRALYGKYYAAILEQAIVEAKSKKIKLTLHFNTQAVALEKIEKTKGDQWQVTLQTNENKKQKIEADNVIIAAGHLPSDNLQEWQDNPHYYATPYQDLSAIAKDKSVIIVGLNATGVDAVKEMSEHTKIYLTSPHGTLPGVRNPVPSEPPPAYKLTHLTAEALNKLESVTLAKVLELFEQEMRFCLGQENFNLEKEFATWKDQQKNPQAFLQSEIDIVKSGKYRVWQPMLDQIYFAILPIICARFSEEEQKEFRPEYFGPYLKQASTMSLEAAELFVKKMQARELEVIPGFAEENVEYKDGQFTINYPDGKSITAPYLINATGAGKTIAMNPLLAYMQETGTARQHEFGGIDIDPKTHGVKDKEGCIQKGLYAFGPFTLGYNIGVFAILYSLRAAKQIVEDIKRTVRVSNKNEISLSETPLVKTLFNGTAPSPKISPAPAVAETKKMRSNIATLQIS